MKLLICMSRLVNNKYPTEKTGEKHEGHLEGFNHSYAPNI